LVSSGNPQNLDDYKYRGTVMAWSAGPDGKIDPTTGVESRLQQGQCFELAAIT